MSAIRLSVLISYVYIILMFAVFRREAEPDLFHRTTPFWTYIEVFRNGQTYLLLECILNVVMLVPLGYFLRGLHVKFIWTLAAALIMSYMIEFLQLMLNRGTFELFDDPFHNVLGAALGYGLMMLAERYKNDYSRKAG